MGCDIHMFIEYKVGNGKWEADEHHTPTVIDYCSPSDSQKCEACEKGRPLECEQSYRDFPQVDATSRNYRLFGALAEVRGEGSKPPKGLPKNVSKGIKEASENYGSDGHSHSYLTLKEFKQILDKQGFAPSDSDVAFYDYSSYPDYRSRPAAYTTVVNYCNKLILDKSAELCLLTDNKQNSVQVRLVFWFDN